MMGVVFFSCDAEYRYGEVSNVTQRYDKDGNVSHCKNTLAYHQQA
jgi:hypothetical protein